MHEETEAHWELNNLAKVAHLGSGGAEIELGSLALESKPLTTPLFGLKY